MYICCRDNLLYLLEGEQNVLPSSALVQTDYAYVRDIANEHTKHAILELMEESHLTIKPISLPNAFKRGLCLLCPEGVPPVKSLSKVDLNKYMELVKASGYKCLILGSDIHYSLDLELRPSGKDKFSYLEKAVWVIGVENEYLFLGAAAGLKCSLLKSGNGSEIFLKMFPHSDIIDLDVRKI